MQLTGKYITEIQRDNTTGTGYFEFFVRPEKRKIVVVGAVQNLNMRCTYLLDGSYSYEGYFKLKSIRRWTENEEEAVHALTNGVSGLPVVVAKTIVETLGTDIFGYEQTYEDLSDTLKNIKGIADARICSILAFLHQGVEENKLFSFLSDLDVPYESILSYMKESTSVDELMEDPYILMRHNTSFALCDKIAMKYGVDPWDMKRIKALIRRAFKQMKAGGHTRMELKRFIKNISLYSQMQGKSTVSVPSELIELAVCSSKSAKIYKDADEIIYISPLDLFNHEQKIIEHLKRIKNTAKTCEVQLDPVLKDVEDFNHITYNTGQRSVFQILKTGGIAILLGGPGTGKTTTINGLVQAHQNIHPSDRILLCAPTGRAAARMAEVSRRQAMTMHKSMQLKWYNKDTVVEPLQYNLIIVDEMSMCDTELFSTFLSAALSGTTILLTGDYEQLPSVGPGQVLRDLVESDTIPVYHLTEVIRQKENSLIVQNAAAILKSEPLMQGKDFHIRIVQSDADIIKIVENVPIQQDTQLMAPTKKGMAGTYKINQLIQSSFHYTDKGIFVGGTHFHENDRIIMNHNNYACDYMNGDVGKISHIDHGMIELEFPDKTLRLSASECDGMSLAYILTVHKSQGAECDHVHLILPENAAVMASRELLYTAITRAKKSVTITSVQGVLEKFLQANDRGKRACGLKSMLL